MACIYSPRAMKMSPRSSAGSADIPGPGVCGRFAARIGETDPATAAASATETANVHGVFMDCASAHGSGRKCGAPKWQVAIATTLIFTLTTSCGRMPVLGSGQGWKRIALRTGTAARFEVSNAFRLPPVPKEYLACHNISCKFRIHIAAELLQPGAGEAHRHSPS